MDTLPPPPLDLTTLIAPTDDQTVLNEALDQTMPLRDFVDLVRLFRLQAAFAALLAAPVRASWPWR